MKKIVAFLLIGSAFTTAQSQTCITDWLYMVPITIDNSSNGDTLWNFQIPVYFDSQSLITNGKLESDARDLRFTDGTCCTILQHYLDSGLNQNQTLVWVKVPMIPANQTYELNMHYGNPNATNVSDVVATFDFWDDFYTLNQFTEDCGYGFINAPNGEFTTQWPSNHVYSANPVFSKDTSYMAEVWVSASSGRWPGVYWNKLSDSTGYSIRANGNTVKTRIGRANGSGSFCRTENNASTPVSYINFAGVWGIAWNKYGEQTARFPSLGYFSATDSTYQKDDDLKVCFGGIGNGNGWITVDWMRVRKFTNPFPTATAGAEETVKNTIDIGNNEAVCDGDSLLLDAGINWESYLWSDSTTNQSIYANSAGNYAVEVTNSVGCTFSDTMNLSILPLPNATFSETNTGLTFNFTNTEPAAASWFWDFGDGNTSAQQNPQHQYTMEGNYEVCLTVIDTNGCEETHCDSLTAQIPVGLEGIGTENEVKIFPVPANVKIYVQAGVAAISEILIYTADGKLALAKNAIGKANTEVNVYQLDKGFYILQVQTNRGITQHPFVLE